MLLNSVVGVSSTIITPRMLHDVMIWTYGTDALVVRATTWCVTVVYEYERSINEARAIDKRAAAGGASIRASSRCGSRLNVSTQL